jgi:hypothetical protein
MLADRLIKLYTAACYVYNAVIITLSGLLLLARVTPSTKDDAFIEGVIARLEELSDAIERVKKDLAGKGGPV